MNYHHKFITLHGSSVVDNKVIHYAQETKNHIKMQNPRDADVTSILSS